MSTAIDRAARDQAAAQLLKLGNGRISNDEFEGGYPRSQDPAVLAIRRNAWLYYSDLKEQKLTKLDPALADEVARCVLFLKSDLSYSWPTWIDHPAMLLAAPLNLISLGLVGRLLRSAFARNGHIEVWPFLRREDYESAARTSAAPATG